MDNSFAYQPATERYERMQYKYCGRSGLKLPLISLGLWHKSTLPTSMPFPQTAGE